MIIKKNAEMSIWVIISIVLVIFFVSLIIIGLISGTLVPAIQKIGGFFDSAFRATSKIG